jgi:hypothetical protein
MSVVLLLKLSLICAAFLYWNQLRRVGIRSEYIYMADSILVAISESMLFLVLALVAKGWKLTRSSLTDDARPFTLGVLLVLSSLLIYSLYTDGYYFLSLTILYFFVVPKIFTSSTQNSGVVQAQILLLHDSQRSATITPVEREQSEQAIQSLQAKARVFRALRITVVAYFLIVLVVSVLKAVLPYNLKYLSYALNESCMFALLASLAYALRPNQSGVFTQVTMNEIQRLRIEELFQDQLFFERFQDYMRTRAEANAPVEDMSKIMVVEVYYTHTHTHTLSLSLCLCL